VHEAGPFLPGDEAVRIPDRTGPQVEIRLLGYSGKQWCRVQLKTKERHDRNGIATKFYSLQLFRIATFPAS
jgi:hypothetical protein